MTKSDLKYYVSQGTDSHFFERSSMKFFGDTMTNYGVRSKVILSNYDADGNYHSDGVKLEVWELYRKRAVKHGLKNSSYFDKVTYSRVFEKC